MATPKQLKFAKYLASRINMSTDWIDGTWEDYVIFPAGGGDKMRVDAFLSALESRPLSDLIERLIAKSGEPIGGEK